MTMHEPTAKTPFPVPGASLKQARERAGMTLEQVAKQTMISLSRLKALEIDRYADVGEPAFVTGYTRAYARVLGLDPTPLIRALEEALPKLQTSTAIQHSLPLTIDTQKQPRSLFWPSVAIVLLVMTFSVFWGLNESRWGKLSPTWLQGSTAVNADAQGTSALNNTAVSAPPNDVTHINVETNEPEREADPSVVSSDITALTPSEESQSTQVLTVTDAVKLNPPEPSTLEAVNTLTNQEPQPTTLSPPSVEAETSTQMAVVQGAASELTLKFKGDCWVEVVDALGKRMIARVGKSGDNLSLSGQAPFDLTLGNAPMVEVSVNGRPLAISTPPGSVVARISVNESAALNE